MTTFLRRLAFLIPAFFTPVSFAFAQSSGSFGQLGSFIGDIIDFFDKTLVPLIFAIAFIVFLWGVYTYFIAGAANEEKRSEGQKFVLYGLIGFVVMIGIWGLVNLAGSPLNALNHNRPDTPTFGSTGGSANNSDNTANTQDLCANNTCSEAGKTCDSATGDCVSETTNTHGSSDCRINASLCDSPYTCDVSTGGCVAPGLSK